MTKEETDKKLLDIAEYLWVAGREDQSTLIRDTLRALNDKREFDANDFAAGYDKGFDDAKRVWLTDLEQMAMTQSAELWNSVSSIVSDGEGREQDMRELCAHIHNIQHTIMGQAAARAYGYRLLGDGPVTSEAARPLTGYGSIPHMASRKRYYWVCHNQHCGVMTFISKQCVRPDCSSHSITKCPKCDERSTMLNGEAEPTTEGLVTWLCENSTCEVDVFPSKECGCSTDHSQTNCPRCGLMSRTRRRSDG